MKKKSKIGLFALCGNNQLGLTLYEHQARTYEPCATLWIDKESDRVELVLDTAVCTYGDWIKGESADVSLVRCGKTNKVVGINLPLYQTKLSFSHFDHIKLTDLHSL